MMKFPKENRPITNMTKINPELPIIINQNKTSASYAS